MAPTQEGHAEPSPRRKTLRAGALGWFLLVPLLLLAPAAGTRLPLPRPGRIRFDPALFTSGDILFRQGRSLVSEAVLAAEGGSAFSHVGLVSVRDGKVWVIHSVPADLPGDPDGVRVEPLAAFLAPDSASLAALFRPRRQGTSTRAEAAAREFERAHLAFDSDFDLATPDRLYCTELVWRAYREAGLDLVPGFGRKGERYLLPGRLEVSPELEKIRSYKEEPDP